jgi:hypothetical protein
MGNSPNNAAIVEKARFLYEGREGIYIEKGALRVRVNSVRIGSACVNTTNDLIEYLAFDLEQIPTSGLPVWLDGKGPYLEPHPLRWEVGTNFETNLFHNYCSAAYGGWSLHFAQKLAAEVVEMATNFAGDDSPELYRKICGHIDAETAKKLSKTKS